MRGSRSASGLEALLGRLVESSPDAVVIIDALADDKPMIYANPSFEALTGYSAVELRGRSLSFLQGSEPDQDAGVKLREALSRGEACHVVLRHYRKDGSAFWNDTRVVPLRNGGGKVAHFAGFHRNGIEPLRSDPKTARDFSQSMPPTPLAFLREDRLTGLYTFTYLEELLARDWGIAQRERHSIAAFAIDIDALELYNQTFGRAAGDSTIRRVAHCVSGCLRRASDVTARFDGGRLTAFAPGLNLEQAQRVGQKMIERVRELRIHHPRCTVLRYVSISVGAVAAVPQLNEEPATLLQAAALRLKIAKDSGRNQAA